MRTLDKRRRVAVLLASFASIIPSIAFSARSGHANRAYTLGGIVVGMAVGGALLIWRRNRNAC